MFRIRAVRIDYGSLDYETRAVLAFTFGNRKDEVFKQFQFMIKPFGITIVYTDS